MCLICCRRPSWRSSSHYAPDLVDSGEGDPQFPTPTPAAPRPELPPSPLLCSGTFNHWQGRSQEFAKGDKRALGKPPEAGDMLTSSYGGGTFTHVAPWLRHCYPNSCAQAFSPDFIWVFPRTGYIHSLLPPPPFFPSSPQSSWRLGSADAGNRQSSPNKHIFVVKEHLGLTVIKLVGWVLFSICNRCGLITANQSNR